MKSFLMIILMASLCYAQTHPNLLLTKDDVNVIRSEWNKYPLFKSAVEDAKKQIDKILLQSIDVPIPVDAAGYTHETHSQNARNIQLAGILFQITQEKKYAEYVKQTLLKYSELYPTLKKHPAAVGNSPGRLFWQSLNEYVWAVNATQAYDCVYDYLSASERKSIEENVFRIMAEFFSVEHVHVLDMIHNHGTWSCAAVGMLGMVLNDKDLIEKSLYGSKKIKEGGFLKQLETLFSPDGFYTEGNYYVRYALMPFYVFAEVVNNYMPELKIYEYHNSILKKGFYTALQNTYTNGEFIPINDAAKGKDYLSPEIVIALDLAYKIYGEDDTLLGIAKKQNSVTLNRAGLNVAKALAQKSSFPELKYYSAEYSDGAKGDEGGVALLRYGPLKDQSLLYMKYTGHGLSHGHYDKLSFLYYDQGKEIIQDYGFARFVNVEPKYGGRYLPENKSFAMQTIAHNTITVDEKSDFDGKQSVSEKYHSDKHFFSCSDPEFQIVSAKDLNAYKGVKTQRTMAMINDKRFTKPVIVDVFKVESEKEHQYDLPYYYLGQMMTTNVKYQAHDKERTVMGKSNGYQHLWNEAEGKGNSNFSFSWMTDKRYYTITSNADSSCQIYFTRIGANDPNFNLRSEPGIMMRWKGKSRVFASVIEPHGSFDMVTEKSIGYQGYIENINVIGSNDEATVLEITGKDNINWLLMISNQESSENKKHSIEFSNKKFEWTGNYKLEKNQ